MITLSLTNGSIALSSISKKGNSSSLENQRGIAKSCAFSKLTDKVLLARIRDIIEPQLFGVQRGLRAGRSTVVQITTFIFQKLCMLNLIVSVSV